MTSRRKAAAKPNRAGRGGAPGSGAATTVSGEDLRRNRIPLYLQIAEIFRRRIADGEWRVKEQIPPLEKLMEEFKVARVTIRQALDILEHEGLVVRYRARGSFVLKRPSSEHWLSLRTDLPSLEGVMRNADTRFLETRPVERAPYIEESEGAEADAYQYVRREISRDGVIYAIVDIHLDRALYERYDEKDLEQKSITGMIFADKNVGPFEGLQTLTVSTADGQTAKLLEMPINAPIARVRRILRDSEGRVIYLASVVYRGEFVKLDIKLDG